MACGTQPINVLKKKGGGGREEENPEGPALSQLTHAATPDARHGADREPWQNRGRPRGEGLQQRAKSTQDRGGGCRLHFSLVFLKKYKEGEFTQG